MLTVLTQKCASRKRSRRAVSRRAGRHLGSRASRRSRIGQLATTSPVWILLPYAPDWRWLLDRDDSPWYPTARLFRQTDTREWQGVVGRAREALRDLVENY
jgi:hypothetical protein